MNINEQYGKFATRFEDPYYVANDPCDEWPVILSEGRLHRYAIEDRTWLHGEGHTVSWNRTGEDDYGDTVYRCVVLYDIDPEPKLDRHIGLLDIQRIGRSLREYKLTAKDEMAHFEQPIMDFELLDGKRAIGYRVHEFKGKKWRNPR